MTDLLALPTMAETRLVDIVAGDAVWSDEDRCFYFVDASVLTGQRLTLVYAGGTTAPFDLDWVRYIMRADSAADAERFNLARWAHLLGGGGEAA
jgi:hypothetical protein